MTKIVLTFGLISGVIVAALMWLMLWATKAGAINTDHGGYFWGYATMIVALSLVFFGIKSYRDNNGGRVTFLKGVQVGILITLICCFFYAISWEAYYRTSGAAFMQDYAAHYVEQMKAQGASDAAVAATEQQMAQLTEMYQNFFVRFGMTLMEILPVGVVVTLISAALLRKREVLPAGAPA